MTLSEADLDVEYHNIIAAVKAGHISEREGFDYYKAFRDGDAEKFEAMRKMFQERLKKSGDCTGL